MTTLQAITHYLPSDGTFDYRTNIMTLNVTMHSYQDEIYPELHE